MRSGGSQIHTAGGIQKVNVTTIGTKETVTSTDD